MNSRISLFVLVTCIAILGATSPAFSSDCSGMPKYVSWRFTAENDFFAHGSTSGERGGDRFYTNGLRFWMLRNPDCQPKWAANFGEDTLIPLVKGDDEWVSTFGWQAGHYIFTPNDIEVEELIPDDRPYAGWLYGGLLFTVQDNQLKWNHVFEAQVGVLGPAAGGEFVQKGFHKLIDSTEPQGWHNQLGNEPAINVIYTGRRRFAKVVERGEDFYRTSNVLDFVPHFGGALGNIQTYANVGFTLRIGKNITGFPPMVSSLTLIGGDSSREDWEFFFFIGADARLMLRNIYLDGNLFKDSHSVDKDYFVYDLKGGLSIRYKSFRLEYTIVSRSNEFSPVPINTNSRGGRHDYGSLSIGVEKAFDW